MNTRSIIIAAILAVVAIVAVRVILDPPHGTAFAQDVKTVTQTSHDEDQMAMQFSVGDITIMNVQARETVPGASVGGGYMIITNNGTEDDRLVGGRASVSSMFEVHEMKMENDVMQMRQLNDGLVIKSGETVTLKPGGFHIMLMGLETSLTKDTSFAAVLNFEKAGPVEVEFNVVDMKTVMQH